MNDVLKKYLLEKYGSENPEAQLQAKYEESKVGPLAAFASGFGDSLAGRAPDLSWVDKKNEKAFDKTLGQLERDKKDAVLDFEAQRSFNKAQTEDDLNARLKDLNSTDTATYQQLASKMIPGQDFSKLTGEQIKQQLPTLEKMYEIEAKKQQNQEMMLWRKQQAADKAEVRKEKEQQGKATQYAARGYGKRLEESEKVFNDLESSGYDRTDLTSAIGASNFYPNVLRSDKGVQQDQAERNFINAVLRRESGAAISPSEFESAEKQYFPRSGDGKDTIAQKKRNRQLVLDNMAKEAGVTWDSTPTSISRFPIQVRKAGKVATVNSDKELKEAQAEGWQ